MSKFTSGPWEVCDDGINVYAPETDTAITSDRHPCYPDDTEARANARLIAAAPLMYEALERLVQGYRNLLEVDALPAGTQWEIATQELIEFGQAAIDAAKVE